MANILHLDDDKIACSAMQGILTRGHHRCIVAHEASEALRLLRELVKFDLVILELKLTRGDNGIRFIEHLHADPLLKLIPLVVYTQVNNLEVVKKTLSLKIQNYLVKPYRDEAIYAEIEKALRNPWRNLHFEEERSFCTQLGLKPDELKKMLRDLRAAIEALAQPLQDCAETRNTTAAVARLDPLCELAESAGAWGAVATLQDLKSKVEMRNWPALHQCKTDLAYLCGLITCHLDPHHTPEGFYTDQERREAEDSRQNARWLQADVTRGPLVHPSELLHQLDALPAGPVVDTVHSSFLMNCGGGAPSLNHLIDLVAKDPALTVQVLLTANQVKHEELTAIEDTGLAATMLGYERLSAMARAMPLIEERHLRYSTYSWAHYWMFQVAVSRVAKFAATHLELTDLAPNAATAGLLHDYGRLLLTRLHPPSFQALAAYARNHTLPLHEAEKRYLGMTAGEIGEHFARKQGLPSAYCDVIRWTGAPDGGEASTNMVALISLARRLCLTNQVGCSGEAELLPSLSLEDTPAWHRLRERVFPSFYLPHFELQAHHFCAHLREELSGRIRLSA